MTKKIEATKLHEEPNGMCHRFLQNMKALLQEY